MNETAAILSAWRSAEARGEDAVLATVVHVRGSAYRRPGARMLILRDGTRVGTVSGGCLEGDLGRKAWWLTENGPVLRTYDTRSEDDSVVAFELGCNGVIQVLLERAGSVRERLEALEQVFASGCGAVVQTGLQPGAAGWRELSRHIDLCRDTQQSRLVHSGEGAVLLEWVPPPLRLVIFGRGHDSVPLAEMAETMGWAVEIAGPEEAVAVGRQAAVVLMTHNYFHDLRLLGRVLPAKPRYLGILGPKKRSQSLFEAAGLQMADYPVHAPVGLDIGADSPAAIALAIVAEIQAVLSGRPGGYLKYRDAPIHAPAFEAGEAGEAGASFGGAPPAVAYCDNV